MNELLPFEYCQEFPSKYVLSPELSANENSISATLLLAYETSNQLPPDSAELKIVFENAVANDVNEEVTLTVEEALSSELNLIDSNTLMLKLKLDTFPNYLSGFVVLATLSYPIDIVAQTGKVKLFPGENSTSPQSSKFSRVIYSEDFPEGDYYKRVRIFNTTEEVVGGIRRAVDLSGSPSTQRLGICSIEGVDFGTYSQAELLQLVPNDVRIEVRRESLNPSNNRTISPLPDDIITWTDELIEFYVPTVGYIDGTALLGRAGAFDGHIRVVTPGSSDRAPSVTTVFYNQRSSPSQVDSRRSTSSDDISMRKQWLENRDLESTSSERGLTFVIDASFVTALEFTNDLDDAKDDLCDAAAELTSVTGIPLDIVDECPLGVDCSIIQGNAITSTDPSTIALAQGLTASTPASCTDDEPRAYDAILDFNNTLTDKFLSRVASPTGGGQRVIYNQALHEFGHILQQAHVADNEQLMSVFARATTSVSSAAEACGVHVRNVSLSVPSICSNVIDFSQQPTACATSPTNEISVNELQVSMRYSAIEQSMIVDFNASTSFATNPHYFLSDLQGRHLKLGRLEGLKSNIPLFNLIPGVYAFTIVSDDRLVTSTFVVTR